MSPDLIWEIASEKSAKVHNRNPADTWRTGTTNSYLVKRKSGGGVRFSRDPLNLMNKHSKKVDSTVRTLRIDCLTVAHVIVFGFC